ncbi:MAG: hypothetical protein Q9163_001233 [Psora crenata]
MKTLRLIRWSVSVFSARTRPCSFRNQCQHRPLLPLSRGLQSNAVIPAQNHDDASSPAEDDSADRQQPNSGRRKRKKESGETPRQSLLRTLPSPPPSSASSSARLSALHARLALSPRLPLETLARCLVDASADPHPHFNNLSLSLLGSDLLGYYTSEAILCRFPRLPTEVLFAAMAAYVGPKTLAAITREWGVEAAAAPGGEVDPGFLQFARREAGNASVDGTGTQVKELEQAAQSLSATRPNPEQMLKGWRRGVSSRTIYDDYFGDGITRSSAEAPPTDDPNQSKAPPTIPTTLEAASATFIRALIGALCLHTGLRQTKAFYTAHLLSRHLDISALFSFRQPTRDLSKLCAREGFESPIARILSETGRKSRHPVFIVGIFSGREKLGEGSGGSLDEARIRAAIAALKGWYLYSPLNVRVPSEAIGSTKPWESLMVDGGEVVV